MRLDQSPASIRTVASSQFIACDRVHILSRNKNVVEIVVFAVFMEVFHHMHTF